MGSKPTWRLPSIRVTNTEGPFSVFSCRIVSALSQPEKKKKKLQESSHASDVSLFDLYSCKYGHHLNFAPGKRNWSDDNQIRGVQCHFHVCLSNTVKHSDNTQKCLQTRKQNCVHPPTNKIDDTCETRLQAEVVLP